jgi:type II secretory pathway component PulM
MQQKIEQLKQYVQGLTKREKIVLAVLAAVVAAFVVVGGVVTPVKSYQSKLAASVMKNDDSLRRIYELAPKLRAAQEKARANGGAQPQNATLFGFIEELATKARMNDRIEYMKPVPDPKDPGREVVELKIRSVYQEDVINLLYDIEHSPFSVKVRQLNIKRVDKDSTLDVIFQVVRYG